MVHYVGDEEIVERVPHGNSTSNTNPYIPVSGAVKSKIASYPTSVKPKKIYLDMVSNTEPGYVQVQQQPRNKKQVYNIRNHERKLVEEQSDLYNNINAVAIHIGENYVRDVRLPPVAPRVTCFSNEAIKEFETIKKLTPDDEAVEVR